MKYTIQMQYFRKTYTHINVTTWSMLFQEYDVHDKLQREKSSIKFLNYIQLCKFRAQCTLSLCITQNIFVSPCFPLSPPIAVWHSMWKIFVTPRPFKSSFSTLGNCLHVMTTSKLSSSSLHRKSTSPTHQLE